MHGARVTGLLIFLLTAGWAGMARALPLEPPKASATQDGAVAVKSPQAAAAQVETDSVKPAVHPAASSVTGSAGESQANPEAPRAKTSA
ncbi:MAG: hypothetical protein ACREA9_28925, partial [Pyrinomonadaceae bacterium]